MVDIALVVSSFLPRTGGVEEHVRHVALGLREQGFDVAVWTVEQGDDVPADLDGIPIRVLPCPLPARSMRALLSFAWRAPIAIIRWLSAICQDRPAVMHVHCYGPNGVWASTIARVTRQPLAVTTHGETFGDANDSFGQSALLRRSLRAALEQADIVSACSAYAARDLETRFGLEAGRARIIANGVDLDEPAGHEPAGLPTKYVLGVGRLVGTKGFDLLIRAFAAADLPDDVALVIGGDGPERDALQALALEQGIARRFHLTGRLDRGEVVAVTAASAAVVVSSRVESFGIVLLEGWRAGVPLIATTHGGPKDIVTHGVDGWLVDPFDISALATQISHAVAGGEQVAAIAAAGKARVAEFTWQGIVEQYHQSYRELGVIPISCRGERR